MSYNFFEVEAKIFNNHFNKNSFKLLNDNLRAKKYIICLSDDEKTKILSDIYARIYRMKGYNVLYSLDKTKKDLYGLSVDYKREIDENDFEENFLVLKDKILERNILFEEEKLKKKMLQYFENLVIEPKKREDFIYNNKVGYLIKIDFLNELKSLEIFVENCSLVFGATFLKINSLLPNISEFICEDEVDEFQNFLNSKDFSFFSGNFVIHPFTSEIIPVVIFQEMKEDFAFGIPDIYELDYNFAYKNDVSIKKILKNNYLCNCGLIDKMDIQMANKITYDEFYDKNIIKFFEKFNFESVLKSSLKTDGKTFKKTYMYYYLPYLVHPYDIDKKEKDYEKFMKDCLIFVEKEDNDKINYLLFLDIVKKNDENSDFLLKHIVVSKKSDKILNIDNQSKDVLRLQALTGETDLELLYEIIYDLWKINYFIICDEAKEIEKIFNYFIEDVLERYKMKDLENFHIIFRNFLNVLLNIKKISFKQLKLLLKVLYPIIPFITEELYSTLFNGKDTLCFENWPWEE